MVNQHPKQSPAVFTNQCAACARKLINTESCFCTKCDKLLPRTNNFDTPNNSAEALLMGRFPFHRVVTFCYFTKGGVLQPMIHQLKYRKNIDIGLKIGMQFGNELLKSNLIKSIDYIVPIPLHPKKLESRTYNQSEIIAQGISMATSIPMSANNLVRSIHNPSQTKLSKNQRWENVDGIFNLLNPTQYSHKHILLLDDIITTGSTIEACAHALLQSPEIKISVATIGEAIQN